jgi:hypothetical protein
MQFDFDCERFLETDKEGFKILEGTFQKDIKKAHEIFVNQIIDSIGWASSKVNKYKK